MEKSGVSGGKIGQDQRNQYKEKREAQIYIDVNHQHAYVIEDRYLCNKKSIQCKMLRVIELVLFENPIAPQRQEGNINKKNEIVVFGEKTGNACDLVIFFNGCGCRIQCHTFFEQVRVHRYYNSDGSNDEQVLKWVEIFFSFSFHNVFPRNDAWSDEQLFKE